MQELLLKLAGQEVDLVCVGGASLRGKLSSVTGGVVQISDDEGNTCHVAIDKIVAVWEKRDRDRQPGFIFKS